ncbi:MAG: hypothetical protein KKF57_05425 [Firmicutes bacterium]|nr:hypothetical protein [Bacillota bacterium]
MTLNKFFKTTLSIFTMSVMLLGCTNKEAGLVEVQGDGLTYSEYFKSVDELDTRENVTYFKPLLIDDFMNVAPDSLENEIHPIDSVKLIFEPNEQSVYLVTSEHKKSNVQNQAQFTYLSKDSYEQAEEFFIISVTDVKENPLEKYDFSKEKQDTLGNELRREVLIEDTPIFHQVKTTNGSLVYTYYQYNKDKNEIATVATSANELYTYYKGRTYHAGYQLTNENNTEKAREEILNLFRAFVLGHK